MRQIQKYCRRYTTEILRKPRNHQASDRNACEVNNSLLVARILVANGDISNVINIYLQDGFIKLYLIIPVNTSTGTDKLDLALYKPCLLYTSRCV